jgi:CheY-like chemotaxis protein
LKSTRTRLRSFHELMQFRVARILLVSSLYDSFIMSEEGHLHETLLSQFIDLNISHTPDLVRVPNRAEALALMQEDGDFDLVVSSLSIGDGDAAQLARDLHAAGHDIPVTALAYTSSDLSEFLARYDETELEHIFLWQGDARIFLAIVKVLEDRRNAPNDMTLCGVPAILVVEDSVRFFSSFLPVIYHELFEHTNRLLSPDLNLSQRIMRMRARPKVLLCETFEEAWETFETYREQILGIVSDMRYPRQGELYDRAGLELCERALEQCPGMRIVLQSSDPKNREPAEAIGASFLVKGSPRLLQELRDILVERLGFGDFLFRDAEGKELTRADDLRSLAKKIAVVPPATLCYHAERNHFSNWLKARTEFSLAERLRFRPGDPILDDGNVLREHLLKEIEEYRKERHRTVIADFHRDRFEPEVSITRLGEGALGGKARGVAFANRILHNAHIERDFPGVDIYVPPSVVLGTQIFDEFLEYGGIRSFALADNPDEEIESQFVHAPFPRSAVGNLRSFLEKVRYPLAVRSSSLLEDSLSQPFAGVYLTCMLPNNNMNIEVRWRRLAKAIKQVYASVFSERAKTYLSMTSYRLEEEKMAVMIQELVGAHHQNRFYPDFAGVARSYNFYPEPGHAAEDGVAALALGLGAAVVGGEPCLRFCPKHPKQIVSFSSVDDALRSSQRHFYSFDLGPESRDSDDAGVVRHPLEVAEEDGTLTLAGSTYIGADHRIVDGISRPGPRLVSFAQVLKHGAFPLAEILRTLLERCSEDTGAPVEIEFAGSLPTEGRPGRFAFLQLRPMALSKEDEMVQIGDVADEDIICSSSKVLGNGRLDNIRDVGSADPSLGIPVGWNQIAGARAIVEAGFQDFKVAPSQGTHFFQNLTSCNVGYFTVNPDVGEGRVDWSWLAAQGEVDRSEHVRHLRFERPLTILMDGRSGRGVILKPT